MFKYAYTLMSNIMESLQKMGFSDVLSIPILVYVTICACVEYKL